MKVDGKKADIANSTFWSSSFINVKDENMSSLRSNLTKKDIRARYKLIFARAYHGVPLKFLTLTTRSSSPVPLSQYLKQFLLAIRSRRPSSLEYFAVRTGEGNGVYHMCLVTDYIPFSIIQGIWKSITGAHRVNISRERNFNHLLQEMTLQCATARYSMSRSFLPDGATDAIEAVCRHFQGRARYGAIRMLGARWMKPDAILRTISCVERGPYPGHYCDIVTHTEHFEGR